MFLIRKTLEALLSPFSLVVFALICGVILATRTGERIRRWGMRVLIFIIVAIVCLAYGMPFDLIAHALESRYSAVDHPEKLTETKWIVVLGGGTDVVPSEPVTSYPRDGSLNRIVEGVRLHRAIPGSRLIFSGYAVGASMSSAAIGAAVATSLGVDTSDIVMEERPRTTSQEAELLKSRIGATPFLLVTSALHMPRAVMIFRHNGMQPIPAPTGHRYELRHSFDEWIKPSVKRVELAEDTWHELLGMAFAKIRP